MLILIYVQKVEKLIAEIHEQIFLRVHSQVCQFLQGEENIRHVLQVVYDRVFFEISEITF